MQVRTHTLFADHFKATQGFLETGGSVDARDVQVLMSKELDTDVAERCDAGFEVVGWAEFSVRGDQGVGVEARAQAARVGASLVLFSLWPAKLRAIKRLPDGFIDLAAVLADPPAGLSPKGYSVLKAAFLRPNPAFQRTASGGR